MRSRIHYSGLVVAGLGFFLTRFTVTLALYEEPVAFLLSGVVPLTLGLGLAAFGVALAVADVHAATVRTVAGWAVVGAGAMLVFVLLTLGGTSDGEWPTLATVRAQAYLSNFLIGGSVGGTLTGLYASRNRRHRVQLERQANRLEVLNRLLRHEVLNALTVIRGYAPGTATDADDAVEIIERQVDGIEATIDEVKHLARSARPDRLVTTAIVLIDELEASIEALERRSPEADVTFDAGPSGLTVQADHRLGLLFDRLLAWAAAGSTDGPPSIAVTVRALDRRAQISIQAAAAMTDRERALLETGEIPTYDDPSSGFTLNVARLLVERYDGTIETAVADGTTTIAVELPRASADEIERRGLPGSGIEPAAPQLLVVLGAGLLAGVVYGMASELLGGSIAGIGVFYGTASPVVGWITHLFHSVVFAFVYAGLLTVVPRPTTRRVSAYVSVGLVWGVALWLGAAGVIAPVWLRLLGIPASIPNLAANLLVAHVLWGVSLGLLTAFGYGLVVPWLRERDWPAIGERVTT